MVENFSLNEEYIKAMKLGDHYSRLCNSTKKEEKKLSHEIIHILRDILDMRQTLEIKDLIKFGFIDTVQKGLDKYDAALRKKKKRKKKQSRKKSRNKKRTKKKIKKKRKKNM